MRFLFSILMSCATTICVAQKDTMYTALPLPFENTLNVSATLGIATGVGLEVKAGILPRLNARLGFSIMSAGYSKNNIKVDDILIALKAKGTFTKVQLLAEYTPKPLTRFSIVGGVAYYFGSKITATVTPVDDYNFSQMTVSKEELGQVTGVGNWSGIAPYLGFSVGTPIPKKKRYNVTMDVGTFYLSRPEVTVDATELLKPNTLNQKPLYQNLKGYRWLPQLQLNFTYKLFSKKILSPLSSTI